MTAPLSNPPESVCQGPAGRAWPIGQGLHGVPDHAHDIRDGTARRCLLSDTVRANMRAPPPVESGIIGHAVPPPEPEADHEKRLQGPRQRPPHDGARRALGAVSRRAVQEVRAAVRPARGQCPEPAGDQGRRPRDRGVLEAAAHLARRQEPPGTGLRAPPALRGGACPRLRRRDASAGDGHRGHRRRRHLRHARPAGADARRPRSAGRGGARPRPQQLDARFLRAGPRPAQVRRAARVSRRALGRRRGAPCRARAGRGGGDRQSQPDQWPTRPRPPLRPALGRGGGAGRARRLSSHRAVVAQWTTSLGATSTRPMAG